MKFLLRDSLHAYLIPAVLFRAIGRAKTLWTTTKGHKGEPTNLTIRIDHHSTRPNASPALLPILPFEDISHKLVSHPTSIKIATMALLVDKLRPRSLESLTYHHDLSNRLGSLVRSSA